MGRCTSCKKQTQSFCYVHQEFVCPACLLEDLNHEICVVNSYRKWVQDSGYAWPPKCHLCTNDLPMNNASASLNNNNNNNNNKAGPPIEGASTTDTSIHSEKVMRLPCFHVVHVVCFRKAATTNPDIMCDPCQTLGIQSPMVPKVNDTSNPLVGNTLNVLEKQRRIEAEAVAAVNAPSIPPPPPEQQQLLLQQQQQLLQSQRSQSQIQEMSAHGQSQQQKTSSVAGSPPYGPKTTSKPASPLNLPHIHHQHQQQQQKQSLHQHPNTNLNQKPSISPPFTGDPEDLEANNNDNNNNNNNNSSSVNIVDGTPLSKLASQKLRIAGDNEKARKIRQAKMRRFMLEAHKKWSQLKRYCRENKRQVILIASLALILVILVVIFAGSDEDVSQEEILAEGSAGLLKEKVHKARKAVHEKINDFESKYAHSKSKRTRLRAAPVSDDTGTDSTGGNNALHHSQTDPGDPSGTHEGDPIQALIDQRKLIQHIANANPNDPDHSQQ